MWLIWMKIALLSLVRRAESWLGKFETEVITSTPNLENTNDDAISNLNSVEQPNNISRDQLQDFLNTDAGHKRIC